MRKREHLWAMSNDDLVESFRERIYGNVTLMAVSLGLLTQPGITAGHALAVIVAAAIGLWLAAVFSTVMAYRLVHNKNMPRVKLIHEMAISRGLLAGVGSSIFVLLIAVFGLIEVRTALIIDISLSLIGLTFMILRSARVTSGSFTSTMVSIVVQIIVAGTIILFKLGSH